MAELAKLLSFMYEEDRQTALELYEEMFDLSEDERALLNGLVSPTRQAVIVARAYDAKERKLSVLSSTKDEDGYEESDEVPPYVLAIQRVSSELLKAEKRRREASRETGRRQNSARELADEEAVEIDDDYARSIRRAKKLDDTQEFVLDLEDEEVPDEASSVSRGAHDTPAHEEKAAADDDSQKEPEDSAVPAPVNEEVGDEVTVESVLADFRRSEKAEETEALQKSEAVSEADPATDVESQLKRETEEITSPEEENHIENVAGGSESQDAETTPARSVRSASIEDMLSLQTEQQKAVQRKASAPEKEPKRTPAKEPEQAPAVQQSSGEKAWNVPVLILFLVIGIPITLVLCFVILGLTLSFLGAAVGLIALGGTLIVAAFSGFAVLADVLILLGGAIVALALALLAFWMFFWMIGAVLIGLIRKVIELAGAWCRKEVPEA